MLTFLILFNIFFSDLSDNSACFLLGIHTSFLTIKQTINYKKKSLWYLFDIFIVLGIFFCLGLILNLDFYYILLVPDFLLFLISTVLLCDLINIKSNVLIKKSNVFYIKKTLSIEFDWLKLNTKELIWFYSILFLFIGSCQGICGVYFKEFIDDMTYVCIFHFDIAEIFIFLQPFSGFCDILCPQSFIDIINLYVYLTPSILLIKALCCFFVSFILFYSGKYFQNIRMPVVEFGFFVTMLLISVFIIVSANSWIILYLSLEIQGMCLYILIIWIKQRVLSIITTLKYIIVSVFGSVLILFGIIHLLLFEGNAYFRQTILALFIIIREYLFDFFLVLFVSPHLSLDFFGFSEILTLLQIMINTRGDLLLTLSSFWPLFFIIMGFLIKIGIAPLSLWLPEVYKGLPLPIFILFATIPKISYIFVFINVLVGQILIFNQFFYYFNIIQYWQLFFFILALFSGLVGAIGLYQERRNLFAFLGWSTLLNISVVVFLVAMLLIPYYSSIIILELIRLENFCFYFLDNESRSFLGKYFTLFLSCYFLSFCIINLCIFYIFYYFVQLLLFVALLNYCYMPKISRVCCYMSDFQILSRHYDFRFIFFLIGLSLLSFFGLPPLLGFWGKFFVFYKLFEILSLYYFRENFIFWIGLLFLLYCTVLGGYSYIRFFNFIFLENRKEVQQSGVYYLTVKDIKEIRYFWLLFLGCNFFFFIWYDIFLLFLTLTYQY